MLHEPIANILARLDALTGEGAEFEDALVALIQTEDPAFTPNANMTYAEFAAAEATFSGYARSAAVVWGPAFKDSQGRGVLAGDSKQFTASAATIGNTVTGYAVLNAAGNDLLWAELFDTPRVIDAAGKAIIVVPKYTYGRQLPAE